MPWIICGSCHEVIHDPRCYCPLCGYDFEKRKPKPPVEAEEALNMKSRKVEQGIEFGKEIESFLDKKAEEIVKEIRKFDDSLHKKENISDNENTGRKLDILDELLEPKDLCDKIIPASQKEWIHCGSEVTRSKVHTFFKDATNPGFLKKIGAGRFIWYCSKECAVNDNQK